MGIDLEDSVHEAQAFVNAEQPEAAVFAIHPNRLRIETDAVVIDLDRDIGIVAANLGLSFLCPAMSYHVGEQLADASKQQ